MYCRNCGKEIDNKAEYCMGCGVKPQNGEKFCNSCGVETNENQAVCIKCGVKFQSGEELSADNEILVVLLCIFLPPLAVWLKTRNNGKTILNALLTIFLFGIGGIIHAFAVKRTV